MTTFTKFAAVGALAVAFGGTAAAQPPGRPGPARTYMTASQHKLGIYATFTARGAVVRGVEPGSPAERFGLEPGDVVLSVNGAPVFNQSSYLQAMMDSGGFVRLRVRNVRDGGIVRVSGSLAPPAPVDDEVVYGSARP